MNPFPGPRSVLLLDNCNIHKSEILREDVEAKGMILSNNVCKLTVVPCRLCYAFSSAIFPGSESDRNELFNTWVSNILFIFTVISCSK